MGQVVSMLIYANIHYPAAALKKPTLLAASVDGCYATHKQQRVCRYTASHSLEEVIDFFLINDHKTVEIQPRRVHNKPFNC